MNYAGMIDLGGTIRLVLQARSTGPTGVPINADALPTFRVFGQSGFLTSGTAAKLESGTVTAASNATPIVVASAAHGLTNGARVTVASVGGNTAANGTFTVANKATNTFELASSAGNGGYTSGGVWNTTGLYAIDVAATAGNGFESGVTYTVVVNYAVSGTVYEELFSFTVA